MINKNAKYGKTENVILAEFGIGDILMIGSKKGENGEVCLAFKQVNEGNPINVKTKPNIKSYDDMKPDIVFIFNKIESIYSVINMLKDCAIDFIEK